MLAVDVAGPGGGRPRGRRLSSSSSRKWGDFVAKGDPLFRVHGGLGDSWTRGAWASVSSSGRNGRSSRIRPFRCASSSTSPPRPCRPPSTTPRRPFWPSTRSTISCATWATASSTAGSSTIVDHRLRLAYRTPDWKNFLDLAVTEIRHFGASSIQVARRLRAMLEDLIAVLPAVRRPALEAELRRLAAVGRARLRRSGRPGPSEAGRFPGPGRPPLRRSVHARGQPR